MTTRNTQWYKSAAATGVRVRPFIAVPSEMPVDSPTERYGYHGRQLLISCRRGLWEAILRETKQSASFWYANSRRELLALFNVESFDDRLGRALSALGRAA